MSMNEYAIMIFKFYWTFYPHYLCIPPKSEKISKSGMYVILIKFLKILFSFLSILKGFLKLYSFLVVTVQFDLELTQKTFCYTCTKRNSYHWHSTTVAALFPSSYLCSNWRQLNCVKCLPLEQDSMWHFICVKNVAVEFQNNQI